MRARLAIDPTPAPQLQIPVPGGVSLAADHWGTPADEVLVLLHGGGQTRHSWKQLGQVLGDAGHYAVAFDARGHGDSGWAPDGDYSRDAMINDLVALIDAVGASRAALIGASMGGVTALLATGEGHLDPSALVLVDVAPTLDQVGVSRIGEFMDQGHDGFTSLDEVADAVSRYNPNRPRPTSSIGLAKNLRQGEDDRLYWHWDPAFRRKDDVDPARHIRLSAAAQRIDPNLAILLVRGGNSDVLTERGAEEFLALCPQSEYVNIAGTGHMVAGDDNDVFASAVIEFIDRRLPQLAPDPDSGQGPVERGDHMGFVNAGSAFWDYLEQGEFRICRCAECHDWLWDSYQGGSDIRCGACGSWNIEWAELPLEGRVYSWVTTNQPAYGVEGFFVDGPYTTVEARVAGPKGPRVIGLFRGDASDLTVDAELDARIEPPSPQTFGFATIRWYLAGTAPALTPGTTTQTTTTQGTTTDSDQPTEGNQP